MKSLKLTYLFISIFCTVSLHGQEAVGSPEGNLNVSSTGGAIYSVKIDIPSGVGNVKPSLAIDYNSQSGNGIVGWGCNVSGISVISRAPKDIYHDGQAKGLTHTDDDAYYLDGQRLIYLSGTPGNEGAVYSPESDPLTKVIIHGVSNDSTADNWFEVQSSNGILYHFGKETNARQVYRSNQKFRINSWYIDYAVDKLGNYIQYTYMKNNLFLYPETISYGKNENATNSLQNIIHLNYELRNNDPQSFFLEGGDIRGAINFRLKNITSESNNKIYRSYEFKYNDTDDGSGKKYSRLISVTESNGAGESLKPIKFDWTYLPSSERTVIPPNISAFSYDDYVDESNRQFIAADINNDGLTDIIEEYSVNAPQLGLYNNVFLSIRKASIGNDGNAKFDTKEDINLGKNFGVGIWSEQKEAPSVIDFDGDGNPELIIPDINVFTDEVDGKKYVDLNILGGSLNQKRVTYKLQNTDEFPLYGVGDFNNDGKGDVVMVETKGSNNYYSGIIEGYNSGTTLYSDTLKLSLPSKPEKLFVQDFNNDGLTDLLLFYSGGYTVFWNQGHGLTNTTFSTNNKTLNTNIGNAKQICQGDFNGDGLVDFLSSNTNDSLYYIAYNNGNGKFTKQEACILNVYDQTLIPNDSDENKFQIFVCDFDNDGKSDVIINKSMYERKLFNRVPRDVFRKTYTYWMRSTGNGLEQVKVATSNRERDGLATHYIIGDFNGNGQVELINYGYNCLNSDPDSTWHYYHNVGYTVNSGKIKTITNGFGSKTDIAYAPMADTNIYTKGTGCSYPMADYQLSMHLVKTVTADNGVVPERVVTNYKYSGLKAHLQGKGILGMASQTTENTTLGIKTETEIQSWNTNFFMPSRTYTKTTINSSGETSSTTTNTAFADKGNRKYFAYPSSVNSIDYDGNGINVTNDYNIDSCYLKSQTTQYGANESMNKSIIYEQYVLAGGVYKPQLVTTNQKHEDADGEEYEQKTLYTYNVSNGLMTREIDHYNSSLPLTKDYTYDNFGNQISSVSTGTGITKPLTTYTVYDDSKRFATKKYTSPESTIKTSTYDTWGNVLTENDETNSSAVLTTTHVYNNWDDETSTISPIGLTTNYSRSWNEDPTSGYYTYTSGEAQPWVKVSYDNEGRELQKESVGEKGITIKETNTYNSKGQIISKLSVNGNLKETEDFTYDGRGRILTDDNHNRQKTTYDYKDSRSKIIYTTVDQKKYMKQYDVWGNIKVSADTIAAVYYSYNSMGKPVEVQAYNNDLTMSYDDVGNQTSLNDPDAGTTTYAYDAAGRVTRQQDARGIVTTNSYDYLGRLTSSSVGDINTTYTYGTSGNEALHLTQKKTGNNYANYTYDAYGRVIKETRNVKDNGTYDYIYSYNDKGELSQKIYPGGLTVKYSYDDYGNHVKTYTDEQTIWELTNETGTITTSVIGGSITTTETHNDKGLLTNLKAVRDTSTLYNMNFSFNPTTGNLMSRTGMMDHTETFAYDCIDRLTNVIKNNTNVMAMTYNENGNITSKTGVGSYSYDETSKPDAVISVDNTDGSISSDSLHTEYNAFGKIMAIASSDHKLRMSFSYGPDQDRWLSEIKNDSITSRYVMYGDDFDNITINGETRTIYYLDGGAIYVQEAGKEGELYYACTDNLGSIVKIVDMSGRSVFEALYDVWGKQTVKKNDILFYRGYTGHEHIPEFGLINMNGRMYDSALGRFLSPDDHVQLPDFSQNYNRYSYCLNNPLKYTDPTGEFIPLLVGAFIGGMANAMLNNKNIHNVWDCFGYFGIGAISGAIGASVGSGVSSALAKGGSFSAGFIGSKTAEYVASSFITGFAIGGAAGFSAGAIAGFGNGLFKGQSFGKALGEGIGEGFIGGISGGLIDGILGGLDAANSERRFFSGSKVKDDILFYRNIQSVGQRGSTNCTAACIESIDKSCGGNLSQETARSWFGGNPNKDGLKPYDVFSKYAKLNGFHFVGCNYCSNASVAGMASLAMSNGGFAAYSTPIYYYDEEGARKVMLHLNVIKKITIRTITTINGKISNHIIFQLMDPSHGGYFRNISLKHFINPKNGLFYMF